MDVSVVMLVLSGATAIGACIKAFADERRLTKAGVDARFGRVVFWSDVTGGAGILLAGVGLWIQRTNVAGLRQLGFIAVLCSGGVILAAFKNWNKAWDDGLEQRSQGNNSPAAVASHESQAATSPSARLMGAAVRAAQVGQWGIAAGGFAKVVARDPANDEAHYLLASALIETADWQGVVGAVEAGLAQMASDSIWRARILYPLADALVMLNRDTEALERLRESVQSAGRDTGFPLARVRQKIALLEQDKGHEIRQTTRDDPRFEGKDV